MPLLEKLLDVLRRGTAGAGFIEATTGQQRNNRQHLGARAELENGEEIREVVAQDVPGDGDGVLSFANALQSRAHRLDRRLNPDVEPGRVVILEIALSFFDHVPVMAAIRIEPEDCSGAGQSRTSHCQLDPVANGEVLCLAHAPDVSLFNRMLKDHLSFRIHDAYGPGCWNQECLVMRTVLFRFLGHQADVGYSAHGGYMECAVSLTVIEYFLVDAGARPVRNQVARVAQLAVTSSHLP